jgi:hypothetical protein
LSELLARIRPDTRDFGGAARQAVYVRALLARGKAYLSRKQADWEAFPAAPDASKDERLNSAIEEQLGAAWKLSDLRDMGRGLPDAELLQASFEIIADDSRSQWIDAGLWLSLADGALYETRDFRLYRRKEPPPDSFHQVLRASGLCVYPSADANPRVRWEKAAAREAVGADFLAARNAGKTDFAALAKDAKNRMKSPLAAQSPAYALRISRLARDGAGNWAVFDEHGTRLTLAPREYGERFGRLSREQAEGGVLIARFERRDGLLRAVPLSLVTESALVRFV